jgi:putative transposase
MEERESLRHTQGECKYPVIFIPKYRRKALYKELRRYWGEVFRRLAEQKESGIEEGHLRPDPVPRMIAIPPQYAVSQVIGYIKGKSAIHSARVYGERKRNFAGQHFGARGFFVSRGAEMKRWFASTIATRSRKTSAWIKRGFGERPPGGGARTTAPR